MSTDHSQADALFFDGNRHLEGGRAAKAEDCFRQALALAPDHAEALANLGLLREQAGAVVEAEDCYRRAIALQPECARMHLNLGALLTSQRRLAEAETAVRQAVGLEPEAAAGWSNLGVLLTCQQREAEACCRKAIALDGGYAKARYNLSYLLLRQGRFEEGWECLEAREWYHALTRHFTCPRWRGEALTGRSIVIGFEGGHGDMIQFCRYAAVLKDLGAAWISVICQPGLKALFATLSGVAEVLSWEDEVPASGWDYWTPPMSLPLYCRTRLDTIPAPIPYLKADPVRIARWSGLLPPAALRVGLAWKGNPGFHNDAERSLPSLDLLSPLGAVAGVSFVSLQKGPGEDEARQPPPGLPMTALGHRFDDFTDTAAAVASVDLVISVDSAVVHLAGALGKPCWVLLADYLTDWRWLTGRDDSPWYPERLRLFRQPPGGGWAPVIAAVAEALKQWQQARGAE